jgi:general secretion pathway protein D
VSYTYRQVGVNLNITPRVTYADEIILQLMVERSGVGQNVNVAGTLLPSFVARRAQTELRLRDGESNLLAGLLKEDDASTLQSFPGIMEIPLLRSLFGHTQSTVQTTDVVMIVTPHIVRSHELTAADLKPMYVGTGQNFGSGSVPQLISPDAPPPPQPAATTPPVSAAQGAGRGAGAGTQPPAAQTPPAGQTPPPAAGQTAAPPPATPPPAGTGRAGDPAPRPTGVVPLEAVPSTPTAPPPAPPAQVVVTAPTSPLAVGGVPATVPIMLTGVSQLSTVSVTVTYDPKVVRAVSVSEGSFMRQGGNTPTFTQKIDAVLGRVDIAVSRPNDAAGASGTGSSRASCSRPSRRALASHRDGRDVKC